MRTSKDVPPPVVPVTAKHDLRTYRFITPVFGGGVEPQECDRVTPVRVASIRGQLRFWWRAVNPRRCTTVDDLWKAEEEVFGTTKKASPLRVRVAKQLNEPSRLEVLEGKFEAKPGMDKIAYGAFPLRSKDPARHGVLHDFGKQTFELEFAYLPDIKDDVDAALWGWTHFGGLGGRTRRGFGAIAQVSPAVLSIDDGWGRFVKAAARPWPCLNTKPEFKTRNWRSERLDEQAMEAQKLLLGALRKIRQEPGVGRRQGDGQGAAHGRSFWPEPDAVRRLFPNQVGEKHRTPVTDQDCFPRAAFGAPIIFHFKQADERATKAVKEDEKDPGDTTLAPAGKHRFASQLLLRPHLGVDDQIQAMALRLAHPQPAGGYVVQQGQKDPKRVSVTLDHPLAIGVGSEFTDPIQRFFEELRK